MIRAHVIALDPTVKQSIHFSRACGVARHAFNWGLAEWKRQYEAGEKPSANKLKAQWNAIRRKEFPWSMEVTKCSSNQAIMNKFKINRDIIQPPLVAGRYWVKKLLPDRNTKYVRLIKTEDGPWYVAWRDEQWNPIELRGEYKFMGPIPAKVYP